MQLSAGKPDEAWVWEFRCILTFVPSWGFPLYLYLYFFVAECFALRFCAEGLVRFHRFWDWKSGNYFQATSSPLLPGSIEAESGIMDLTLDRTGSRLLTANRDKSITMWKELEGATPETHPVNFRPPRNMKRI